MKKILIALVLALAMVLPMAAVSAVTYDGGNPPYSSGTVILDNKNPDTWVRLIDGRYGTLMFPVSGSSFTFTFLGYQLEHEVDYSLIYYANPYPGNNPGALIGTGTSDSSGNLSIIGAPDLGNIPTPPDSNILVDHSVAPDFYETHYGAKIWLVPSACYNAGTKSIISWQPTRFLFETDLINYTDTGGGTTTGDSSVSLTTTITEPVATIGFTVSPTALDFGSVQVGQYSAVRTMTVTNTGTVPIKITISVSAGFYTDCMELSTGGSYTTPSGWIAPTIPVGSNITVYARVKPTAAYASVATGSMTFFGEYAP